MAFGDVSWKEDCGAASRVRMQSILGEGQHDLTATYGGGMSVFQFHGVYSEGAVGAHREVGGLTVRHVESVFQQELNNMAEFSPWMNINAGFWDGDLDSYVGKFFAHGARFLALRWPSVDNAQPSHFYSLIVNVPDTQEIFEIISATAPSDPRVNLREFPMARHIFTQDELGLLMVSSGPTPLHISRTHYDLDAVKEHYENMLDLKPLFEMRDEATGIGFVSFWHQSHSHDRGREADVIRVQVVYWNTPDQSKTVAHTTEWLERSLEQLNSQYMLSYTGCWPVWGDNHYTVVMAPGEYFKTVMESYDAAGIGYMLFKNVEGYVFTGYFPLPGGFYLELQPDTQNTLLAPEGTLPWIGEESEVDTDTLPLYCFRFTCPA